MKVCPRHFFTLGPGIIYVDTKNNIKDVYLINNSKIIFSPKEHWVPLTEMLNVKICKLFKLLFWGIIYKFFVKNVSDKKSQRFKLSEVIFK